jgi:hypothetical protein
MSAKPISGMLMFRKAADSKDGRELWSVVGVIAAPPGTFKAEHQHVVVGQPGQDCAAMTVLTGDGFSIDRTEEGRGNTLGHMLLEPIWRT